MMNKILSIVCMCIVLLMNGCNKSEGDKTEKITILISYETGEYKPWGSETTYEGMKIKEKNDVNWDIIPLTAINGFTYEEGYEYELLILKTYLSNPPMDGSSVTYTYIELLSKGLVI